MSKQSEGNVTKRKDWYEITLPGEHNPDLTFRINEDGTLVFVLTNRNHRELFLRPMMDGFEMHLYTK